ncbi:putative amino acid/polyamine transporter I, cationic amino acid transporter [Medicago truncatula]|uniref:Cationic amino acid transporter n=1 Tax=Medicago truncatula TaxID=3880 RepID=A0A072U6U4_MEDTR|nr:cationic amino acid transporter 9, chloroplastic isoform X2 [Medicago truncatula]KEH21580.1 cationic amino acid transporter [Medicago truncatula]RHN44111.1 putative amino acid/polyamine transporter I, cationic amino acid transporter [Medicago truncatula]
MGIRSNSPSSSFSSSSSTCCSRFLSSALRSKRVISPSEKTARDNSGHGLSRRLGVFDLILLGIGASIGAGIFVVTGTVAHDVGPAVTLSFIFAGASCVINALCYAELASRFPAVVGGAYLYTYTAFNELTAFLVFSQLMLDYHIGAASIARSLANYIVTFLEIFPVFKDNIPKWIGHGLNIGNVLSINALAPILLILLTLILCLGVRESSAVNSFMTVTKIIIVIVVIFAGAFEVDVSNWSPFVPNGIRPVFTGATVVFFAYVGFDAVANSAEESKKPQRDLPIGIIGSLLVCIALYIGVCLVITGMVPYSLLGEEAPLAEAFKSKGLKFVSVLISIGAIAGLTTALLVGLYVQSRLYLGLGRDGLLPAIFAKVHPKRHTPLHSQIWVGCVASIMAGLLNVRMLSHILSVGTLTGYSVVSACVVVLRWKGKTNIEVSSAKRREGVICLIAVAVSGFAAGLLFRYETSIIFVILAIIVAVGASLALHFRQVYAADSVGFSCPGVPIVPNVCIFFNMFLFGQLHHEAWVRFVILSILMVGVYAIYGQYHADPTADESIVYHEAPEEPPQ